MNQMSFRFFQKKTEKQTSPLEPLEQLDQMEPSKPKEKEDLKEAMDQTNQKDSKEAMDQTNQKKSKKDKKDKKTKKDKKAKKTKKSDASKTKKNSKWKKVALFSLLGILAVASAVAGIVVYRSKNQTKIDVYSVDTLNCADWWENDSQLSGTLTSDFVQEVRVEPGKEVKKIYVKVGDKVKEGDTLLKYNIEEEELNLQLQELQIKSANIEIKKMEEELNKLKNTKTKGSINGTAGTALSAASGILGIQAESLSYLVAENEPALAEEEPVVEDKEEPTEKPEDKPEDKPEPPSTEAPPATEPESPGSDKEEPTIEVPDTEDKTEEAPSEDPDTTEEEPTTEEKPDDPEPVKDVPKSGTISSLEDRAKYSSGNGKTEATPYIFLLVKDSDGHSADITGSLINSLIKKGLYAEFREYDSLEAYEAAQDKPSSKIKITPNTKFVETISEKARYAVPDLVDMLVTITKISITPNRTTVSTGGTYSFQVKVTGKNIKKLTAKWSVSGNKSSDTEISSGILWVADNEKADKIKITVTVSDKKASMTLKVKKTKNNNSSSQDDDYDDDIDDGDDDDSDGGIDDGQLTGAELREAIEEKEEELREAQGDLAEAKINYKEAKKEVDQATIKSKITGTVKTAYTKDALPTDNSPAIIVSSDNGIYVKTQVNEMDLSTVKVGGTITCTSWETDQKYEAVVKEVSDYPTNFNGYYEGNPNSSYYPIVAYIADAEGLTTGESVSVTYSSQSMGTISGDAIYLQKAYVRSDSDGRYVFKVGEKERLEKQYIKTGKTLNGQYIEVLKGITEEDYICFPYGKKVKPGAKTKISENDEDIIY